MERKSKIMKSDRKKLLKMKIMMEKNQWILVDKQKLLFDSKLFIPPYELYNIERLIS